jgi:DNA-binding XRE family transcriptional regulator
MVATMRRHTRPISPEMRFSAMIKSRNSNPRADNPDFNDLLALFGANLRAARLKSGLTQTQLAEQAGLLQQYVSLVESGKQNVTLTTALSFARVVGLELIDLLHRPKSPTRGMRA